MLVDFVDELCVGVVSVLHCNMSELTRGNNVTVLWDNNREYNAKFLVAG